MRGGVAGPAAPVLNRRLVLERDDRAPDGAGGWLRQWAELGVLWASVEPRVGREVVAEGRAEAQVSHRILVRAAPEGHPARPKAGQRLREGGRVFALRAVTEADARGRFLICWADEGAEDGA